MRLLAFATEAGGAAVLIPVLNSMRQANDITVAAKEPAFTLFQKAGFKPRALQSVSNAAMTRILKKKTWPDVLLTSAASLPQRDMTEKHLWIWARERGIPSVAVLDQWQHYALRFSGTKKTEHLSYLPDWIAAMDDRAKEGLAAAGVPGARIVGTGQPAFDRLSHFRRHYSASERALFRKHLGLSADDILLCFVSESFARDFGMTLGFSEQTVLRDLLAIGKQLTQKRKAKVHLAIKLHPQNNAATFKNVRRLGIPRRLKITVHGKEQLPLPLVMASDVVIGMSSVLLIESILLGRPTISYQPHAKHKNNLMATVAGAIPFISSRKRCFELLDRLLYDRSYRHQYLLSQSILRTDGAAAKRVAALLRRVGSRHG